MVYNASGTLTERLLFTLIPPHCLLCQAAVNRERQLDLCAGCERDLPRIDWPCPRCGLALTESEYSLTCGACLKNPPAWNHCSSAVAYAEPVNRLILQWKQRGHSPAGRVFTRLLARQLAMQVIPMDRPDAILPVPQHWQRHWRRGFNPAASIARQLGRELGLPVLGRQLQRVQATPAQQGLTARQRRRNLKGAFTVSGTLPAHVALVDDVVTTGSTASEICRLLKKHGVERVDVWCLARTPKQHG